MRSSGANLISAAARRPNRRLSAIDKAYKSRAYLRQPPMIAGGCAERMSIVVVETMGRPGWSDRSMQRHVECGSLMSKASVSIYTGWHLKSGGALVCCWVFYMVNLRLASNRSTRCFDNSSNAFGAETHFTFQNNDIPTKKPIAIIGAQACRMLACAFLMYTCE